MVEKPNTKDSGQETPEQKRKNLLKFYEFYNNCVELKRTDFDSIKRQLEQIVEELLRKGKIGKDVRILSRIKSPASTVGKLLRHDRIHDIYGVTILTPTSEEMREIEEALNNIQATPKRRKNEKRGYEAVHFEFLLGEGKTKTMIECHLQTFEAYKNMYPHSFYKVRRKLNQGKAKEEERELTKEQEAQITEETQRQYESGELQGFILSNGRKSGVPEMWEARFNMKGKIVERQLDEQEALRITHYPCLENLAKSLSHTSKEVTNQGGR